MATITDTSIVRDMLRHNGSYQGDPVPDSVWSYRNTQTGKQAFAVFYRPDECDIHSSPFVSDAVQLFTAANGLTAEGIHFISHDSGTIT